MVTSGDANFADLGRLVCRRCWCLTRPGIGDGRACLCFVATWRATLGVTGATSVATAPLAAAAVAAAALSLAATAAATAAAAAAASGGNLLEDKSRAWRWRWLWWRRGAAGATHRLGQLACSQKRVHQQLPARNIEALDGCLCVTVLREPLDGYE